jgi:hypothetical protein
MIDCAYVCAHEHVNAANGAKMRQGERPCFFVPDKQEPMECSTVLMYPALAALCTQATPQRL